MSAISSIGSLNLGSLLRPAGGRKHSGKPSASPPAIPQFGGTNLKQIQNSVLTALQSAQSAESGSSPNKTIESAIAAILKNGLNSTSESGETDASPESTTFFKALAQYGVSPQQFQSDFAAAVKDVQNNLSTTKSAQQNLPTGSLLDVVG